MFVSKLIKMLQLSLKVLPNNCVIVKMIVPTLATCQVDDRAMRFLSIAVNACTMCSISGGTNGVVQ